MHIDGYQDLTAFWLRKTKKPVLAVLMVRKDTENAAIDDKESYEDAKKRVKFYRGTNMEVSMPTGSLCAERNVIGSALADDLTLKRVDLKYVAVFSACLDPIEPQVPVQVQGSPDVSGSNENDSGRIAIQVPVEIGVDEEGLDSNIKTPNCTPVSPERTRSSSRRVSQHLTGADIPITVGSPTGIAGQSCPPPPSVHPIPPPMTAIKVPTKPIHRSSSTSKLPSEPKQKKIVLYTDRKLTNSSQTALNTMISVSPPTLTSSASDPSISTDGIAGSTDQSEMYCLESKRYHSPHSAVPNNLLSGVGGYHSYTIEVAKK